MATRVTLKTGARVRRPSELIRVVRDVVTIVGSILLAFALDAWWDLRREFVESRELIHDLVVEFDQVQFDLDRALARNRVVIDAADSVLAAMRGMAGPATVSVETVGGLLLTPTTDPQQGTLDALLTTGAFHLVPNDSLANLLADWPAAFDDVREEERAAKSFVHEQLLPALGRITDLRMPFAWRLGEVVESRHRGEVEGQQIMNGVGRTMTLVATREIINLVETRRYLAAFVINNHQGLRDHAAAIREQLDMLSR